jgi:hypothetical protein
MTPRDHAAAAALPGGVDAAGLCAVARGRARGVRIHVANVLRRQPCVRQGSGHAGGGAIPPQAHERFPSPVLNEIFSLTPHELSFAERLNNKALNEEANTRGTARLGGV